MKRNTLNKLKSDYEELEIMPSVDLWSRLDERLDKKPEITVNSSFQWIKYAAVIVLLVSVGTVFYFTNKNNFNSQKRDYIVKKRPGNPVNFINPEFENQQIDSEAEKIENIEEETFIENKKADFALNSIEKKEHFNPEISEFKKQEATIIPSGNIEIKLQEIKNNISNSPVIAETEKTKATYINANELLLGREFDKTRESNDKSDIKFGVFNFDKPKIENVTVLGITVVDCR